LFVRLLELVMPGGLTSQEQITWTQRIRKEEAVNGKASNNFSIRAAVSVPDVPSKFKPGHQDPRHAMKAGETFDPQSLGWAATSSMVHDFRKCMARQTAGPPERHQFPESHGQEIGWCTDLARGQQSAPNDRSAPAGSNPSKLGIGWLQKDGHGMLAKLCAASAPIDMARVTYEQKPKPRISKDGNPREEMNVPPYATTCGAQERAAARKDMRRLQRDPSATNLERQRAAPTPHQLQRTESLPHMHLSCDEQLTQQEALVAEAMHRQRHFKQRCEKNKNYHPLSQSDVALFADEYAKSNGYCPAHRLGGPQSLNPDFQLRDPKTRNVAPPWGASKGKPIKI